MWPPATPQSQIPEASWLMETLQTQHGPSQASCPPGTRLPGPRPPQGSAGGLLTDQTVPQDHQKAGNFLSPSRRRPWQQKGANFFTTNPTMHADYNSQNAAGGPDVNPVMAPGLPSPVPFLVLKPNCCTYFQPSQSETNFGIFDRQLQLHYLDPLPYHINKLSFPEYYPRQSTFC